MRVEDSEGTSLPVGIERVCESEGSNGCSIWGSELQNPMLYQSSTSVCLKVPCTSAPKLQAEKSLSCTNH